MYCFTYSFAQSAALLRSYYIHMYSLNTHVYVVHLSHSLALWLFIIPLYHWLCADCRLCASHVTLTKEVWFIVSLVLLLVKGQALILNSPRWGHDSMLIFDTHYIQLITYFNLISCSVDLWAVYCIHISHQFDCLDYWIIVEIIIMY